MKNQLRDIFLQLLRIGLWENGELKIDTPLSEQEWLKLHNFSINHTVEAIIYDSFKFLKEDQLPPHALRLKWTVRVDKIERYNSLMNSVIANQYNAFCKIGLHPILQKGQGVANCYITPLHRMSGDIDWYFEDNGYEKARSFLKEKNMVFRDLAAFSLDYNWDNVTIEHHKKLFDIQNPFKASYLNRLKQHYKDKYQTLFVMDTPVKLLAPELQIFQVNIHILKHLLAFGIGLRQLCDSARLYYTYISRIDSEALRKIYSDTGVLNWVHVLHALLVKYLGLPSTALPFPYPEELDPEWMLNEIWFSGNFGFYDPRFEDGKITALSAQPDGAYRLWSSFKRYFKYAPQEAFFFPIVQTYSRFVGKDKD